MYLLSTMVSINGSGQLILSQANLDASTVDLVDRIKQTYELILENQAPPKINATKDVLVEIAQVIQECAQFVVKYSETKNFCGLIVSVLLPGVSSYR